MVSKDFLIFKTSVLGKVIPLGPFYFSILIIVKKICCYAFLWVFFWDKFHKFALTQYLSAIINFFSITPLYFQVSFMSSTSLKLQLSPWCMAILPQKGLQKSFLKFKALGFNKRYFWKTWVNKLKVDLKIIVGYLSCKWSFYMYCFGGLPLFINQVPTKSK